MIQAVIFDIDDTLYNFKEANQAGMAAALDYCRRTFGLEESRALSYYQEAWKLAEQRVGTDTAAIHNRLLRFQCMAELLGQPPFPHARTLCDLYWDTLISHMQPSPGILPLFQKLKSSGIRIGIGTDMTAYVQFRKLEALGLAPFLDMVVTSEEAGAEKPHPRFFSLCVEKSGCPAHFCAFIGDNIKKDVEGAIASGLQGIWYCPGRKPEKMPFPVITSFEDCLQDHAWLD